MESDSFALRTALFTLLGLLLLGTSFAALQNDTRDTTAYLVVSDESVSGLAKQSRVYYKGVEVGSVQEIFFAPGDFNHVQILIHVDQSIPIAENTYARLALRGITGEYDLRLDNSGPLGLPLESSATEPAVIHMQAELITRIGSSFEQMLDDISAAGKGLATLLAPENQQQISRLFGSAADAAEQISTTSERLQTPLDELTTALSEFQTTIVSYRELATHIDDRTRHAGKAIEEIANAASSMEALATTLESATTHDISAGIHDVQRASQELTLLVESLQQDPQRVLLGNPGSMLGPGEQPARRDQP